MIYNGPNTSSPLISSGANAGNNPNTCPEGSWRGVIAPFTINSTHPTGALTLVFKSDGNVNKAGWAANINCVNDFFFVNGPLPTFCVNAAANIEFSSNYTFNAGNLFTVELSDNTGDFSSPTVIGTLNSTVANGSIPVNIPALPQGLGYRVRITSSNPSVLTSDVAFLPFLLDPIVFQTIGADCGALDFINFGIADDISPNNFDLNN